MSISRAGEDFVAGITFADFQRDGIKPFPKRWNINHLQMAHNGRHSVDALSWRSHDGISSGPDDEPGLAAINASSVSSKEIRNSDGKSSIGEGEKFKEGRNAPTATNLSLNKLARDVSE